MRMNDLGSVELGHWFKWLYTGKNINFIQFGEN